MSAKKRKKLPGEGFNFWMETPEDESCLKVLFYSLGVLVGVFALILNVDSTRGDIVNFGTYDGSSSLLDAYNNPSYTAFREKQRAGVFEGPCELCTFAYTGAGFTGQVTFRAGPLAGVSLYHKRDYYNNFFSLKEKGKPTSYYSPTPRDERFTGGSL